MSSLYLLEDAVYFALQTSSIGSTIAKSRKRLLLFIITPVNYALCKSQRGMMEILITNTPVNCAKRKGQRKMVEI